LSKISESVYALCTFKRRKEVFYLSISGHLSNNLNTLSRAYLTRDYTSLDCLMKDVGQDVKLASQRGRYCIDVSLSLVEYDVLSSLVNMHGQLFTTFENDDADDDITYKIKKKARITDAWIEWEDQRLEVNEVKHLSIPMIEWLYERKFLMRVKHPNENWLVVSPVGYVAYSRARRMYDVKYKETRRSRGFVDDLWLIDDLTTNRGINKKLSSSLDKLM